MFSDRDIRMHDMRGNDSSYSKVDCRFCIINSMHININMPMHIEIFFFEEYTASFSIMNSQGYFVYVAIDVLCLPIR